MPCPFHSHFLFPRCCSSLDQFYFPFPLYFPSRMLFCSLFCLSFRLTVSWHSFWHVFFFALVLDNSLRDAINPDRLDWDWRAETLTDVQEFEGYRWIALIGLQGTLLELQGRMMGRCAARASLMKTVKMEIRLERLILQPQSSSQLWCYMSLFQTS